MICPSCGAEVAATKFCENCGSPLVAADQTAPVQQPSEAATQPVESIIEPLEPVTQPVAGADDPAPAVSQPTEPVGRAFSPEMPGEAAWQAQPQEAYQAASTGQMPPQPQGQVDGAPVPPVGGQPLSYTQANPYQPAGNRAPNAAFVLVIVGLVLSLLFVTFLPGLVCSIIGLVLNAGYNKKGLDNPRKTATTVIGVIGIVMAILCLVFSIIIGVVTARVIEGADQQGIDIVNNSIEASIDSSGNINITVDESSGSASALASSASASSASSASASASSASSASSVNSVYYEDKYHDAEYNPTLYSLLELTGAEFSDLLETYNFMWDSDYEGWVASDGSLFAVIDSSGDLTKSQIAALPRGAAGQSAVLYLCVEGYKTPNEALSALSKDIVVEDSRGDNETYFAIVYGSPMVRYLAVVVPTDTNEQTLMIFTEESISSGLFASLIGVDAGSSIKDVWKAITG